MKEKNQKKIKDLRFAILATDAAIFTVMDNKLKVLLININLPPYYKNSYALPGGLILPSETADDSVYRHIKNKTGINVGYIEQLYTFSSVNRDPRGRVVSVAYMCFVPSQEINASEIKDGVVWKDARDLPKLAYDHNEIVGKAVERLQSKLHYTTLIRFLLDKKFTLPELQKLYEIIFRKKYDKRNFRKKILELNIITKTGDKKKEGAHRPADLFKFTTGEDKFFEIL